MRFSGESIGTFIIKVVVPGGKERGVNLDLSTLSQGGLDSIVVTIWEALDDCVRAKEDGLQFVKLGFPTECTRMDFD